MILGEVIKNFRKEHGMSQRQFAIECDLSNGYISMLEKNQNPNTMLPVTPSLPAMRKIAKAMNMSLNSLFDKVDDLVVEVPEDDDAWETLDHFCERHGLFALVLSTEAQHIGRLYMAADDHTKAVVELTLKPFEDNLAATPTANQTTPPFPKHPPNLHATARELPLYLQSATAGFGNYLDDAEYEMVPYDDVPHRADFAIRITGDSMEPMVKDGQTVFVEGAPEINSGEVGIFILNGESYIKKLRVDYERREVRLISLNKQHGDKIITADDDLRTVGRVLGVAGNQA